MGTPAKLAKFSGIIRVRGVSEFRVGPLLRLIYREGDFGCYILGGGSYQNFKFTRLYGPFAGCGIEKCKRIRVKF